MVTVRLLVSSHTLVGEVCDLSKCRYFSYLEIIPVMAAVAVRKKVISIGHFSPSFYLQSLQFFILIRLNQELLYESIALKIRKKIELRQMS